MALGAVFLAIVALAAGCGKSDPRWAVPRAAKPPAFPAELQERLLEIQKNPHSSEAQYRLAVEYLRRENLRDAAERFRKALELDPQNNDALMGLWQVSASLTDTANLVALAARAQQLNVNDPSASAALREVGEMFERALAARPQEPWLLLNTAFCYAKLREWNKAETYIRQAAAVAPNTVMPRLMLGNLFLEQGLVDPAAREIQKLATLAPNDALIHEALGRVRLAQQRFAEAQEEFTAAQRLRPDWIVPHMNAGDLQLRLGQYDLAEMSFTKAWNISPKSLSPALALIQTLTLAGKKDRAIDLCGKMLADYPNYPPLLNNLAYLYAETGRNLDRAIEYAQKLVNANPRNPTMRDTLGWAYHRAGQIQKSVEQLQEAVLLAPNTGGYYFHLAQAQLAAGLTNQATVSLQTALTKGLPPVDKAEAERLLAKL